MFLLKMVFPNRFWRLALVCALAGVGALGLVALARAAGPAAVAPQTGETCFATPDDGATVYSSTTAQAVRDAVGAAPAGGSVKLAGYCAGVQVQGGTTQTVLITQTLTLAGGYTLTNWFTPNVALNITTLDAQGAGRVIYANTAITLAGFMVTNGYIITTPETPAYGGGIFAAGAMTLTQMHIYSNTAFGRLNIGNDYYFPEGGGVHISGTAHVANTTFLGNIINDAGGDGGGAYFNSDTHIQETTFLSNTSGRGGGAHFNSTATMSDATFTDNIAAEDGGGAYFTGPATVVSTTFTHNTGYNSYGGVVFRDTAAITNTIFQASERMGVWFYGPVRLVSATVQNNQESGAIFYSSAEIIASAFLSNTTQRNILGGGAVFGSESPTHITGSTFANNISTDPGGGVRFNGAEAYLTNTTFISNSTHQYGGGLYTEGLASVHISGGAFISNSGGSGGGLVTLSPTYLTGTVFQQNQVLLFGGGAYFGGHTGLSATTFLSNTAQDGGGAYFAHWPDAKDFAVDLTNSTFIGNNARQNGGGAYFYAISSQQHPAAFGSLRPSANRTALSGPNAYNAVNLLFARNTADHHGVALYVEDTYPLHLRHTTIAHPTLLTNTALYMQAGTVYLTNTLLANFTRGLENAGGMVQEDYTLFSNVPQPYSGMVLSGGHSLTGTAAFVNPANDDYHLGPGSAAINAGTNAGVPTDIDGDPRPLNGGYDIGYDEARVALRKVYLPLVRK